jgi:excisionase family DNA binding protein
VASAVPHDLLTPREVAEVMRVSTMTVYRLIKSGELPAMRVGKHLRIRGHDVAEFLDARIVHTEPAKTKKNPAKGSPWPAA